MALRITDTATQNQLEIRSVSVVTHAIASSHAETTVTVVGYHSHGKRDHEIREAELSITLPEGP